MADKVVSPKPNFIALEITRASDGAIHGVRNLDPQLMRLGDRGWILLNLEGKVVREFTSSDLLVIPLP